MSTLPPYMDDAAAEHKLMKARQIATMGSRMDLPNMPNPVTWAEEYFYLYDTANLISLFPIQREALREAITLTGEGKFKYSTVLFSWPKKSAKSSVIAMMVDWIATHRARSQIRLAANDRRQADSRIGHYLRESIKLGARLGYDADTTGQMQQFRKATKISATNYTITYPNGTIVEMVPADPTGEAGGNDDMLVFSELWGWKTKAHQQLWSEMTISPTRFGYAQRWIDTYAGFTDDSVVLKQLYDVVVKDENKIHPKYEFYATKNIFATWITGPHFPWQTPEYYVQEKEALEPNEYERLHRNQWSQSTSSFAPKAWWKRCIRTQSSPDSIIHNMNNTKYLPPRSEDEELVLALDAGTDSDCFAIWGGTKIFEVDVVTGHRVAKVVQRYVKVWYPEEYEGHFDFTEPMAEIRRLCEENNVIQICYDKWQLKHFVDMLEEDNIAWFDSFDQMSERDIADKLLYDMIRRRHFIHWDDPDLTKHFGSASKKVDGRKLRIIKKERTSKIDGLIACSMAVKRIVDLIPDF